MPLNTNNEFQNINDLWNKAKSDVIYARIYLLGCGFTIEKLNYMSKYEILQESSVRIDKQKKVELS
jgi:hypothetical protein